MSTRIIENRGIDKQGMPNLYELDESIILYEGAMSQGCAEPSYMLVSEYEGTGYIIGRFEYFENAEKEMTKLMDAQNISWKNPSVELYEKRKGFKSYKVHESCKYGLNGKSMTTNGTYSVAIIDMTCEGFSIETFMFERANTIYAIPLEYNDEERHRFFSDNSYLLAN